MSSFSLIGSAEAAVLLGITQRHVARLVASGALTPATKVGNAYAFDRSYIEQIAADERGAAERRSALAAAPSAHEDCAIQDQKTGVVIMESRRVNLNGGDAA